MYRKDPKTLVKGPARDLEWGGRGQWRAEGMKKR